MFQYLKLANIEFADSLICDEKIGALRMKISIQQLRYFVKVAEAGSITGACKLLGVTQGTVSSALSQLETELGAKLLSRTRGGMNLTEKGSDFLLCASKAVAAIDEIERRFGGGGATVKRLLVAMAAGFAEHAFYEAVDRLMGNPDTSDISFGLQVMDSVHALKAVAEGVSDIGVFFASEETQPILSSGALEYRRLFSAKTYMLVDAGHPLAGKKSVTYDELAGYPDYSFNRTAYVNAAQFVKPVVEIRHGVEVRDYSLSLLDFIRIIAPVNGYALWSRLAPSDFEEAGVVAVPVKGGKRMEIGYATRAGYQLNEAERMYLDIVSSYVKRAE
jgi:DNA-binding transcriptional LysR family regulator